jgi:hypothetical protein
MKFKYLGIQQRGKMCPTVESCRGAQMRHPGAQAAEDLEKSTTRAMAAAL